jgi:hypothetical protein
MQNCRGGGFSGAATARKTASGVNSDEVGCLKTIRSGGRLTVVGVRCDLKPGLSISGNQKVMVLVAGINGTADPLRPAVRNLNMRRGRRDHLCAI